MPDSLSLLNNVGVNSALYPPLFQAFQASTQNVPTGFGGLAMILGNPTIDTYSGWASGSPTKYTPTVPGWYLFTAAVAFTTNSSGARLAQLQKNGSTATASGQTGQALSTANFNAVLQTTGLFQMNGTTDFMELWAYQDSGVSLVTIATSTFMSAVRIHL